MRVFWEKESANQVPWHQNLGNPWSSNSSAEFALKVAAIIGRRECFRNCAATGDRRHAPA